MKKKLTIANKIYILDDTKLLPGDIILTTTSKLMSRIIKRVTGSDYSHAMLYVGKYHCVDSTGNGVQAHNTQRMSFVNPEYCQVIRRINPLSGTELTNIVDYVNSKIGMQYSKTEALFAGVKIVKDIREGNRQFCSRLVAQAYSNAGSQIVKNPDYCSPEEICSSELFSVVPDVLKLANDDETKLVVEEKPITSEQQKAISGILKSIRQSTGVDIQSFGQIAFFLNCFPKFDEKFCEIIENSGFLSKWKDDFNKNLPFYDYNLLVDARPNIQDRKDIAVNLITMYHELKPGYEATLLQFKKCHTERPLGYFDKIIVLYEKLNELNETRFQVANMVMNEQ